MISKKKIVFFFVATLVIIACHKKAVPEISSRTEFPKAPKSSKPPMAENSPEAIAAGKTIFETKCAKCHDLKPADAFTADRWTSILKSMIPKARLNDEQGKQVTAYIMANAKK